MSERMSKEVLTVSEMTITKVLLELHRARASEDQKDALIKALADALENLHRRQRRDYDIEPDVVAALRLAGRL